MASLVSRPRRDGTTAHKVQWRLGGSRDGAWQSETFDDRRQALKFRALVGASRGVACSEWLDGQQRDALDAEGLRGALRRVGQEGVRRVVTDRLDA